MAVNHESLFRQSPVVDNELSLLHIPVVWHESLTEVIAKETMQDADALATVLQPSDAKEVGMGLFGDRHMLERNNSMLATIRSLSLRNIKPSEIAQVHSMLGQMGEKALIFLHKVDLKGGDEHISFASYVSRGNEKNALESETRRDFTNLQYLSNQFRHHLTPEAQQKYSVVSPLVLNKTAYRKQQYAFFTMPIIPYREIGVDLAIESTGTEEVVYPFLRYAFDEYPLNPLILRQINNARYTALYTHLNGDERIKELGISIPYQVQTIRSQWQDIITAESLVYLLSGNRFPKEHLLNAGDWMGLLNEQGNGLSVLALITVRGGFTAPMPFESFQEKIITQMENMYNTGIEYQPFMDLDEQTLQNGSNAVEQLLRPDSKYVSFFR